MGFFSTPHYCPFMSNSKEMVECIGDKCMLYRGGECSILSLNSLNRDVQDLKEYVKDIRYR